MLGITTILVKRGRESGRHFKLAFCLFVLFNFVPYKSSPSPLVRELLRKVFFDYLLFSVSVLNFETTNLGTVNKSLGP